MPLLDVGHVPDEMVTPSGGKIRHVYSTCPVMIVVTTDPNTLGPQLRYR